MNKIYKVCENISLGLFVNGSYSLLTGNLSMVNFYLTFISIYSMALFIILQEDT